MRSTKIIAARQMSCPVRGTWIEIQIAHLVLRQEVSCPVRGTWIEIFTHYNGISKLTSRAPYGARGLKFKCRYHTKPDGGVVPRTGHVD